MNSRDLEYLVAVAEELHFRRAAERCHVSQPTLSAQLRKLEGSLGVDLFERTKRRVKLTDVGAEIVAQARTILDSISQLQATAAMRRDPLSGDVSLGLPPTIGPFLIPILLDAAAHYLPALNIRFVEDLTDNLEAQLVDGSLDMAVLATTPVAAHLLETPLYEEPFWVALPTRHPLTRLDGLDISDLDIGELLLLSDGHCLRDQIYDVCGITDQRAALDHGPKTQKTSLTTILSLVGAGRGITLVPAMSLSAGWMTDAGIAVRRLETQKASRKLRLVYRKSYYRTQLVEKLADVIAGAVPDTVKPVRR